MSFTKVSQQTKKTQPIIIQQRNEFQDYSKNAMKTSLGCSSSTQQNFFLSLGSGNDPYDPFQPKILWKYNIQNLVPGQKKRLVQIINMTAMLKNFSSCDFPSKIGLKIIDVTGYGMLKWFPPIPGVDGPGHWQTVATNICCWAIVKSMNSTEDQQTKIKSFNVLYQNQQNAAWDIGMLQNLQFRIVDEQGVQLAGPFNNPVDLQFRLVHVSL